MKGFLFLTDQTLTENKRKAMSIKKRKNLPNVIPIIKITPDKEENSNNATSSQSARKDSIQQKSIIDIRQPQITIAQITDQQKPIEEEEEEEQQQQQKQKSTNGVSNSINNSNEQQQQQKSIEKSKSKDNENKESEVIQMNNRSGEENNGNNELSPNSNDTITSNSNVLMEDASVYSTVSSTMDLYGTRTSTKSNTASIFTLTINQEQLVLLRRASKEFLEKITHN